MFQVFSSIRCLNKTPSSAVVRLIHITTNVEAARKGTREKARQKKVKVEVEKVGFIPHNQRGKDKLNLSQVSKHIDDSWKAIPKDNAYVGRYYRWTIFPVAEAIQCHRETHHPTMYNVPSAPLNVEIELNMQAEKSTRFVDNFTRMAVIPHKFDHGEDRHILVFAKDQEHVQAARDAGATLVGGVELIKDIQSGELQLADYQYVIAHPNILPDLVVIRGLMKRKFPNPKSGTLGTNLVEMVQKFQNGIHYSAAKDENQKDFGLITTCIGPLDMDATQLEGNLAALIKDIDSIRPKRSGKFITRVLLKSPPSQEQLKIDPFVYIEEERTPSSKKSSEVEEIDDEEDAKQSAVN